jgi:hypothetical protein
VRVRQTTPSCAKVLTCFSPRPDRGPVQRCG